MSLYHDVSYSAEYWRSINRKCSYADWFTMMGFAGLSFLGLGVQLPKAEWGSMINEARGYLQLAPWAVLFPGAAIILTVMIFNYLGDAVRDYLDVEGQRNE